VALLEIDGVTRRYGALVALDQVAMRVEDGEVRAVIGPNGAGKTTLFNVITGTVKPSAGTIRFAGHAIAGLPSHQVCRLGISRTFQITSLFPEMSARDNARLSAQARHTRRWQPFGGAKVFAESEALADAALKQLGLSAIADRPAGLLSHGDQRLLEVAMAMAQQPRVLLLDEPTRSLDPVSARQLRAFLRDEICKRLGCTILLATHTSEEAFELCDRVAILNQGRPLAIGHTDKLQREFGEDRYLLWTRNANHPEFDILTRRGAIRHIVIRGVDDEGWAKVEMAIPGGPEAAASVLEQLVQHGLIVARFERVELSLGELIERVITRKAGGGSE
jgi:branched-chain amino acid transport system ATP-binding protein